MTHRIALYPGTFDPITKGHQDIIERASRLCDELYVCVAIGYHKHPLFSLDERTAMVKAVLPNMPLRCEVKVIPYEGLLVSLCQQLHAQVIVRGLRAVSDYEYELQLAAMNRELDGEIETIFLTTSEKYSFISSTMVREIAKLGGKIERLVDKEVNKQLVKKFANNP